MATFSENGATIEFPDEELRGYLADIKREGPIIASRALTLSGEALIGEAQYTSPVKTGVLQGSHKPDSSGLPDYIDLGATANYAIYVHETHKTRRQWFLKALVKNAPRVLQAALRKAMRESGADA